MDWLAQATKGFQTVEAEETLKSQALTYLKQWLTQPEFSSYLPQLHWLIESKDWAGLLDRFYQILPFGTGGRRGAVGLGPNRMNLWTLGASVQGHCEYLKEKFPGVQPLRVVLAYDVRRFEDRRKKYNPALPNPVLHLSSKDLAHHAALVYAANGIHSSILQPDSPRFLATPELSFSIRQLQAHGGLNISASHNPPDDNGGKFYDERGGQPIAPDDQIMADLVERVEQIRFTNWNDAVRGGKVHFLEDSVHQAYIDLCRRQSLIPPPKAREIKVVYTPLHGVGSMTALETLQAGGFYVLPVQEQMTPDGQFTNVTQAPNPEVPASFDRAEALAKREQADLVLSTDPDADRIGAMIPDSGGFRYLTGNQIAVLLTHFKLNKLSLQGRLPPSPIVVRTEVTTSLITRIARQFRCQVVDNLLVGFKYIADVLWQLEQQGRYEKVEGSPDDFVIGCEESHGILVTPKIRDKDASGAALLLAELALDLKRQNRAETEYLDSIYREFGYCCNLGAQIQMTGIEGKEQMARMMGAIRRSPLKKIAGLDVSSFEDLRDEKGRLGPLRGATDALSRNFLVFRLGAAARVVLRPSGTEPKAKIYVETCTDPCRPGTAAESWQRSCREADDKARKLTQDFESQALALAGLKK
jgi:phosphoglucomutase/phosphomannomutase